MNFQKKKRKLFVLIVFLVVLLVFGSFVLIVNFEFDDYLEYGTINDFLFVPPYAFYRSKQYKKALEISFKYFCKLEKDNITVQTMGNISGKYCIYYWFDDNTIYGKKYALSTGTISNQFYLRGGKYGSSQKIDFSTKDCTLPERFYCFYNLKGFADKLGMLRYIVFIKYTPVRNTTYYEISNHYAGSYKAFETNIWLFDIKKKEIIYKYKYPACKNPFEIVERQNPFVDDILEKTGKFCQFLETKRTTKSVFSEFKEFFPEFVEWIRRKI